VPWLYTDPLRARPNLSFGAHILRI
jgi:hypothetical protein